MNKLFLFYFLAMLTFSAHAQKFENWIKASREDFPVEKIHIHFDKELYLPGETIWFKGYLFEENLPTQISTTLYISLYDDKGILLQQKITPIINSTTDGYFDIPDTIKTNQIICRAFTSWMLNFDTSFFFNKAIRVISNRNNTDTIPQSLSVSLKFFPEGGDAISGEQNTIAFKAVFNNGLPFEFEGQIKNKKTGEFVQAINTKHDGMGTFNIEMVPDEAYYAEWVDNNKAKQQTDLPIGKRNGVLLKVVQQNNKLWFNVVNKLATDTLHVIGYMHQEIICKAKLPLAFGESFTGLIPMDSLPSGIMQLTVFNSDWHPFAERVSYIHNKNNFISPAIIIQKKGTQKRENNIIEIQMPDSIPTNMSIAITDADFNSDKNTSNIMTNLLLTSDIKGVINNPAYYFNNNGDSVKVNEIDLVMLTNGWRRYNWNNLFKGVMPLVKFKKDNYLNIFGQVSSQVLNILKSDERVNLIIKHKDSTNNYYVADIDKTGLIKATGQIFYDTARIYFSFKKDKIYNKQMAFSTSNYTLQQPQAINNFDKYLLYEILNGKKYSKEDEYQLNFKDTINYFLRKVKSLQTVVVKTKLNRSWRNDPIVKLEAKYASGLFIGGATSYSYDLLHDEQASTKGDIYNYISHQASNLIGVRYVQGAKQFVVASPHGSVEPLIFVDEALQENEYIQNLALSDIAFIKIIPRYYGMKNINEDIIPAIAIYRKKGEDLIDKFPKDTDYGIIKIPGYSPVKEFYTPDYSKQNNSIDIDTRTTLLWQPYILTDKNNLKIPIQFYNSDFCKRFRIVLEGFNDEGKLIHIEKLIEN
jgi:hypothetical protein